MFSEAKFPPTFKVGDIVRCVIGTDPTTSISLTVGKLYKVHRIVLEAAGYWIADVIPDNQSLAYGFYWTRFELDTPVATSRHRLNNNASI